MNFAEYTGKALLAAAGIEVPHGRVCASPEAVETAARELGPCVIKAQVPSGKRGKLGGIRLADTGTKAAVEAQAILGNEIGGHTVERVLVESRVAIAQEYYAAIVNDPASKGPLLLISAQGGMEIEELVTDYPDALLRLPVDVRHGLDRGALRALLASAFPRPQLDALETCLAGLYGAYAANDAELLEINPLIVTEGGDVVALDCKFSLDDAAAPRHPALTAEAPAEPRTPLERRAQALGLAYIELEGAVGILANGAGLTMTTMDVVSHYGGSPANFLEIGGDAYTKGTDALRLVLDNPRVKSLMINFCGAFARTDVMTRGVLDAWDELEPQVPVRFCINGTGEEEALTMVRERLGVTPSQVMDEAVQAAVEAAR